MELYVLMAQRKCDYPGQYAPEALCCMNEPEYADNPDYLNDAKIDHLNSGEFDAVEIVAFKYNENELERRLFPERSPISCILADTA